MALSTIPPRSSILFPRTLKDYLRPAQPDIILRRQPTKLHLQRNNKRVRHNRAIRNIPGANRHPRLRQAEVLAVVAHNFPIRNEILADNGSAASLKSDSGADSVDRSVGSGRRGNGKVEPAVEMAR